MQITSDMQFTLYLTSVLSFDQKCKGWRPIRKPFQECSLQLEQECEAYKRKHFIFLLFMFCTMKSHFAYIHQVKSPRSCCVYDPEHETNSFILVPNDKLSRFFLQVAKYRKS